MSKRQAKSPKTRRNRLKMKVSYRCASQEDASRRGRVAPSFLNSCPTQS